VLRCRSRVAAVWAWPGPDLGSVGRGHCTPLRSAIRGAARGGASRRDGGGGGLLDPSGTAKAVLLRRWCLVQCRRRALPSRQLVR
jgi:hypothetical protein